MTKKLKIGIIGANSYIARNFIITIPKEQFELALYDIHPNHIDNYMNYVQMNLLDKESIKKLDVTCDIIYMFSGKTGTEQGFYSYEEFIDINEKGLLNLLDLCRTNNSKAKIIFPSTRLVYKGKSGEKISEDSQKEFKTIYAINKYACEEYLKMYNQIFGINYCVLRICVPYGSLIPGVSSYGTMSFFIDNGRNKKDITIFGDGSQRRTLTHIYDLCQVLIKVATSDECCNDIYNVGGGDDVSIYEIAKSIAELFDVKIINLPWPHMAQKLETGDTVFDSTKLDKLIDINYKHNFRNWMSQEASKLLSGNKGESK